ncbi:MAG: DUF4251 domain-containing protein [Bacteroidota bacterium]|nr:DUF4251 domain-containing protein [Bacteroidota bacterium]MDP4215484.1 DUF4251 domain-containing protein [Bacteroidota bacterium]MDP4246722.1 DUF4251 domain-containing protein [Bacteroidota bacterium]MDP4252559.1 DUF4251 domain-containing protein [Bacteroidota bacterium]MDP4257805.1 DUF4251 domain-containing protein [Bacteroidota bacterium]
MHIMKTSSAKRACILFVLALCIGHSPVVAQSVPAAPAQDKKAAQRALIKNLIESQSYVFQAQTAMPMGGRVRQLTSDYDLTVGKASIVSYLPYFGRAYSAPIDPREGGIQFTSKDFSYSAVPGKKGGWDIRIKPKDAGDVQQLSLSVSEDGYATLQVINTTKQPISFHGIIAPTKPKRK